MRGTDPPACVQHRPQANADGTINPGFYNRLFSGQESVDLAQLSGEASLADEINAARVAIRRILDYVDARGEALSPAALAQLTTLVFRGADSVARLLKTQEALSGAVADGVVAALEEAARELAQELDLEV